MTTALNTLLISTLALALACPAQAAQVPPAGAPAGAPAVSDARFETRAPASGLDAALREAATQSSEPLWVGYSVPMVAGMGSVCCWSGDRKDRSGRGDRSQRQESICRLESENNGWSSDRDQPRSEQPLAVLLRFEKGRVREVRGFSTDCRLDAGGHRFVWLGDVKPAESIAYLAARIRSAGEHRDLDEALAALALHRDSGADEALEGLAAPGSVGKVRQQALFWMGQTRGERGAKFLAGVIRSDRDDRDDKIREHAIFSLSQSAVPWAAETIVRTARDDRSPHIRSQALFWLAQMKSANAQTEILSAIEKDADPGVRKQAVFALSQLHGGKGVQALLKVAHESRDSAIRKEALFWLAQSKDPAALAYLDKVLND
jgi:hypothetical protein